MSKKILIVEDGSSQTCEDVVRACSQACPSLRLRYLTKTNSGPGLSRNAGAEQAEGDFFVFLDSDCVVPPGYVEAVKEGVERTGCDAFGGPDRAGEDFDAMQKAVSYSMTSFFTTGGIRGGGEKMEKFHPRSFNMGVSRKAFQAVGGFRGMRYGEDIDFSIRLIRAGFRTVLLKDAWVCHKRRTAMKAFFRQVWHSGAVRIELERRHPRSLKPVHTLPALFTLGSILLLAGFGFFLLAGYFQAALFCFAPLAFYALLIFVDSLFRNGGKVALLSVKTSFVQLWGYGCGFISAFFVRSII